MLSFNFIMLYDNLYSSTKGNQSSLFETFRLYMKNLISKKKIGLGPKSLTHRGEIAV